jgi:hypothetical protein
MLTFDPIGLSRQLSANQEKRYHQRRIGAYTIQFVLTL